MSPKQNPFFHQSSGLSKLGAGEEIMSPILPAASAQSCRRCPLHIAVLLQPCCRLRTVIFFATTSSLQHCCWTVLVAPLLSHPCCHIVVADRHFHIVAVASLLSHLRLHIFAFVLSSPHHCLHNVLLASSLSHLRLCTISLYRCRRIVGSDSSSR